MATRKRLTRERKARMDLILDAAERLFVERGYAGTSIKDIARSADFSRTSIYQYFSSKQEIYLSILERYTAILTDRVRTATAACRTVPEKVRAFLNEMRGMIREKPSFFKLYFIHRHQVEPRLSGTLRARLNAERRELENVFRDAYREGLERGEVRQLREKDASNLFFAQIMGMMLLHEYYADEFDVSLDEHLEMSLDLYLEYIGKVEGRSGRLGTARAVP